MASGIAPDNPQAIQTASNATALPSMFLPLLVLYGTFKGLSEYRQIEGRG